MHFCTHFQSTDWLTSKTKLDLEPSSEFRGLLPRASGAGGAPGLAKSRIVWLCVNPSLNTTRTLHQKPLLVKKYETQTNPKNFPKSQNIKQIQNITNTNRGGLKKRAPGKRCARRLCPALDLAPATTSYPDNPVRAVVKTCMGLYKGIVIHIYIYMYGATQGALPPPNRKTVPHSTSRVPKGR